MIASKLGVGKEESGKIFPIFFGGGGILKHRNSILFGGKIVYLWKVAHNSYSSYGEFCKKDINKKFRNIRYPVLNYVAFIIFFMGHHRVLVCYVREGFS